MNNTPSLRGAPAGTISGMAANLVIENLDEFSDGILNRNCAYTVSDYAWATQD